MKQACEEMRGPVDNSIHRINLYLVDLAVGFSNTYPSDSDLSGRYIIHRINLYPVDNTIDLFG